MSAAAMQPYAAQGLPIETIVIYAALLALMIGVFQLSLGLLRMGVLVDFLSHPVVVGFTNAGALIIATSQVPKLFGLNIKADQFDHSYEFWWATLTSLGDTKLITLVLGAFALTTLIVLKKYAPRLPGVLITVLITTVLSWAVDYKSMGGSVIGTIPEGLPSFSLPIVEMSFQNFVS